jgi:hypothetical protein
MNARLYARAMPIKSAQFQNRVRQKIYSYEPHNQAINGRYDAESPVKHKGVRDPRRAP